MRRAAFLLLLSVLPLSACSDRASVEPQAPVRDAASVGSDRDEHGCITSAGYRWCEREKECTRPWELMEKTGSANSPEAFDEYCQNPKK
jgi:hypothetical protein